MTKTRIALIVGGLLVAIQLVPIDRTNPPVEATVTAPPEVLALLKRACFDCHSHETRWAAPQAYVAPASWLVAWDVKEGREEMNFSRWNAVSPKELEKLAKKLPEEIAEGAMPPPAYRLAHPEARLTDAEKSMLQAWGRTLAEGVAK